MHQRKWKWNCTVCSYVAVLLHASTSCAFLDYAREALVTFVCPLTSMCHLVFLQLMYVLVCKSYHIALWNKSNGSYDIKEFGTLPLIFSTSKYFRWKFQPWPSFFPHANIPDTWKRGQLSLEQMKKMEKVKVKSHLRYLAACSIQKKRWDIWRIFFSDFRSVFSP